MTPQLADIRTLDDLLGYLAGELHWPIASLGVEDLTFEFDPVVDLGLGPKVATRITRLLKLRPLTASQPFSIFFIEFESRYLPSAVLRRILNSLVSKRRNTLHDSPIRPLKQDDLLFVSACGDMKGSRRIDFAHFIDRPEGGSPAIKLLGWDPGEPAEKLAMVRSLLRESLSWPDGGTQEGWRAQWRKVFEGRPQRVRGAWVDLDEASKQALIDLYAVAELTTDALPYTDDFEWMRQMFNATTGHHLSQFEFWRALTAARKAGKLPRKERGPAVRSTEESE
jgi:hypothetical protein